MLSTLLVWAGPAQVILISALGAGASVLESAIAVGLSGVRLLPMVVALLPLLRTERTPPRDLILPAHLTAVSMWVESLRLLPGMPRLKEWAYVGCSITILSATYSHYSSGDGLLALEPLLTFGALVVSYMCRPATRRLQTESVIQVA